MVLIAVLGLMPMILAMQSVDEALRTAAYKRDLGEVTKVIEKGADANAADKDGITPLYRAAEKTSRRCCALAGQRRGS
jgi:hypothetical protein